MRTDATRLRQIFDRSSGLCHVCGRRVSFRNYARLGMRGAWEIEHSIARALGVRIPRDREHGFHGMVNTQSRAT
jgi:hypothetical protein